MGPHSGGVAGKVAEEPGRGERAEKGRRPGPRSGACQVGHVRVKQERNVRVAKMRGQGACTGRVKKAF